MFIIQTKTSQSSHRSYNSAPHVAPLTLAPVLCRLPTFCSDRVYTTEYNASNKTFIIEFKIIYDFTNVNSGEPQSILFHLNKFVSVTFAVDCIKDKKMVKMNIKKSTTIIIIHQT